MADHAEQGRIHLRLDAEDRDMSLVERGMLLSQISQTLNTAPLQKIEAPAPVEHLSEQGFWIMGSKSKAEQFDGLLSRLTKQLHHLYLVPHIKVAFCVSNTKWTEVFFVHQGKLLSCLHKASIVALLRLQSASYKKLRRNVVVNSAVTGGLAVKDRPDYPSLLLKIPLGLQQYIYGHIVMSRRQSLWTHRSNPALHVNSLSAREQALALENEFAK